MADGAQHSRLTYRHRSTPPAPYPPSNLGDKPFTGSAQDAACVGGAGDLRAPEHAALHAVREFVGEDGDADGA